MIRGVIRLGAVAVVCAVSLVAMSSGATAVGFESQPPRIHSTQAAATMLSQLRVTPETHATTYNRDYFGSWNDADGDSCNTRKEVLLAESTSPVTVSGSRCTLSGGSWTSSYDSATTTSPASFDIDHMVPLKEAWISGAYGWSSKTLRAYANDLGYEYSLVAVSARSNRSKSDQDPATWMPPDPAFACQYVSRWIGVKYRWSLAIDELEKLVLANAVQSCGAGADVTEPALASIESGDMDAVTKTRSENLNPTPLPNSAATANGGLGENFANCDALQARYPGGIASSTTSVNLVSCSPRATRYPLTLDPVTYALNARLDRDKDGVACER